MRCLVTGASGFIGRALAPYLRTQGYAVSTWPRDATVFDFNIDNIAPAPAAWIERLNNIDAVVHLAGFAHQRSSAAERERYFRVNRDGTLRLAAAARAAGVKRFIFLSSAKVFGEGGDVIYSDKTIPNPSDAYAQSKWQAEQLLVEQNAGSPMEIVILRPPLVYGLGAGANFARLLQLARTPLPLPFASIQNRRALIGLDNLLDLIALCLTKPEAANHTWSCTDAEIYALPDIIAAIRRALDRDAHLFSLPRPLFSALRTVVGPAVSMRLFGDFHLDCSRTYRELGWTPPYSMEQILRAQLRATIQHTSL